MSDSRASSARQRSYDKVERTLALIKPEALEFAEEIENIIIENGFDILSKRTVQLTDDEAVKLYEEHSDQIYFQHLVEHMTSNDVIALCLSKLNAISEWKSLMGPSNVLEARVYWPSSIRAKYGMPNYDDETYINAVHGSENLSASIREINLFFPEVFIDSSLQGNYISEYLQGTINPTLTEGLNELCKEKPKDPIVWLADWLLMNNPNNLDYPDIRPGTGIENRDSPIIESTIS